MRSAKKGMSQFVASSNQYSKIRATTGDPACLHGIYAAYVYHPISFKLFASEFSTCFLTAMLNFSAFLNPREVQMGFKKEELHISFYK